MSTITITIAQEGYTIHRAIVDCTGDIDAQVNAIIDYIRPQIAPSPASDPEAFALQAAVTAYRLTLAAQARKQADAEAAAAAARAMIPQEWLADLVDIKARQEARAAAHDQRRKERQQRRAHAQEIPYTPVLADLAAMDTAIDADLTAAQAQLDQEKAARLAAWQADVQRARANNARTPIKEDPDDDQDDDQDDESDYDADAWNDPHTPPSSSYVEDWHP